MLSLTRTLAVFPPAGRKVREFDDESVREVFAYSHRIIYRVAEDTVPSCQSFTESDLS